MESILKTLRSLGPIGSFLANVITFLTTNWVVTLATLVSIGAGLSDWATGIATDPRVQNSAYVFLVLLWTYIGISGLVARRRPITVRPYQDYDYGLTFEGITSSWDATFPEAVSRAIDEKEFGVCDRRYVKNLMPRLGKRQEQLAEFGVTGLPWNLAGAPLSAEQRQLFRMCGYDRRKLVRPGPILPSGE